MFRPFGAGTWAIDGMGTRAMPWAELLMPLRGTGQMRNIKRSADGSSNVCRGAVVRIDRVLEVSAVATLGAHMMPGAFEDAEDGTLRARAIFVRELPSSNAACDGDRGGINAIPQMGRLRHVRTGIRHSPPPCVRAGQLAGTACTAIALRT